MDKHDIRELRNGTYRIRWREGGCSLAAIGTTVNGDKWMAPINWVQPSTDPLDWLSVESVDLLSTGVE